MNKGKDKRQHIKVFVRVRPINDIEKIKASPVVVACPSIKEVVVNERPGDKITKKFTFDKVFEPSSKQVDVYKYVANPLMKEVLDGYNCTIFAYGQTGTGKTYTMEGNRDRCSSTSWMNDSHAGIIPRALGHLFDELRLLDAEYSVKASYLEIYNEELIDLLSPVDDNNKIRLFEDATKKGAVIVNGLEELTVRSKEEIYAIMDRGSRKRQTASTLMNAVSSRSHTVFSITVRIKEAGVEEGEEVLRTGKLNLVDLAGSENIGRSGAIDKRAREAGNINQSLLTLGRVITALVERTPHVPYRESKLTRLLQESLGGRTKTCIIATVSPSYCSLEETLSTLDYAHRAKNIQNKPEVNQKIGKIALIKEYTEEIDRLKADLIAAREKSGVYLAEENYNSLMTQIQTQTREISELLLSNKSLAEVVEKKEELNSQLSESLEKYTQDLHHTKLLLKETKVDREKQIFLLKHRVETEKELSKQASTLLSVADSATNDNSLLHNTLCRKRSLEDKNLAVCKAFAETCKEKLAHVSEVSTSFQEARIHSYESIMKELRSGYAVSNNHCNLTSRLMENALKSQSEMVDKMCATNTNLVTDIQHKVETINEMSTVASNSDSDGLQECFSKILEQQLQMTKILSVIPRETQIMLENITAKIEQQEKDLQAFFNLCNKNLEEVAVGTNDIEKLLCRLDGLVDGLEKWKENTKRKTAEAFKALHKTFYSTMNDFELEESSLRATVDEFELSSLKSSLETVCESVPSSEEKFNCQKEEINSCLIENFNKVSSSISSLDLACVNIHVTATQEKSLVPERESERLDIIGEGLNDVANDVIRANKFAQSSAQELVAAQRKFCESLKSSSEIHLEQQSRVVETVVSGIQKEVSDQMYYSDLLKNISECDNLVEKLIQDEVKKDSPSGQTPQRRVYRYPRALVCTSPHERILSRFTPVAEEDDHLLEPTNDSVFLRMEDSVLDSSESSKCSSQCHFEKIKSKSTSNISYGNSVSCYPCTSEPNIPYSILEKENTSPLKTVPCTKSEVKRQVLHDHNKT